MRLFRFAVVTALVVLALPSFLMALGGDHPDGNVDKASYWTEGMLELANRKDRVHGYFVNTSDVFFYAGDAKALNDFLRDYAKLQDATLELVLHVGKNYARSPWDKADRGRVDWVLYLSKWGRGGLVPGGADPRKVEWKFEGKRPPCITRVEVWLGDSIQLEKLEVPAHVQVTSGGDIEQFIAQHRKKQLKPEQ
jgi:hypothetical protein